MTNSRYDDWVRQRTLDEGMRMGAVNVLDVLVRMMEEHLRRPAEADKPGTVFWLQRVKDMLREYDSRERLGDGYFSKLLEERKAFILQQPLGAQENS